MAISSDEVNFLVYRYLQESGFHHSAFAFGYESFANRSNINSNDVPPGALVSFVQKGLQYLELEANLTRVSEPAGGGGGGGGMETLTNGTNGGGSGGGLDYTMEGSFGALTPSEMMTKDITQLRAVVNERRENSTGKGKAGAPTPGHAQKKGSQHTARKERDKEVHSERPSLTGGGKVDATTTGAGVKKAKVEASADVSKFRKEVGGGSGKGKDDGPSAKDVKTAKTAQSEEKGGSGTNVEGGGSKGAVVEKAAALDAKKEGVNGDPMVVDDGKNARSGAGDKNDGVNGTQEGGGGDAEMADAENEEEDKVGVDKTEEIVAAAKRIPESDVMVLTGHTHEVFFCAWNPKAPLLASGSGDQTARIWAIPEGPIASPSSEPHHGGDSPAGAASSSPSATQRHAILNPNVTVCSHYADDNGKHEVTTLDWNSSGTLLATGSYDGKASVWNREGAIQYTLDGHQGPIFSMKWNFDGSLLLSGSLDKTAIVWNAATGEAMKQFKFHDAPMLDVDWRNDHQFATCSTDRIICVCQVDMDVPLSRFCGHENEVNAIEWDPLGRVLASCSDDNTAKIWEMDTDDNSGKPTTTLVHDKEIYTIKWRRTEHGQPSNSGLLATASFDTTVKLWDVERSVAVHTLAAHSEPVYTIAFNPDGQFLLSGSFDKRLHVWSMKDGSLVRTYKSSGGIFEACWSNDGKKMAACHADNTVSVIDFRM